MSRPIALRKRRRASPVRVRSGDGALIRLDVQSLRRLPRSKVVLVQRACDSVGANTKLRKNVLLARAAACGLTCEIKAKIAIRLGR